MAAKCKRTPEIMAILMDMRKGGAPYAQIRDAIKAQLGVNLDRTTLRNWYVRSGGKCAQGPNPIPGQVRKMGVRACLNCGNWVSSKRFCEKRSYCKTCNDRAMDTTGESMVAYSKTVKLEDARRQKMKQDAFAQLAANSKRALS